MFQFDIERAISGEPVICRNGMKARYSHKRHQVFKNFDGYLVLRPILYFFVPELSQDPFPILFNEDGTYYAPEKPCEIDLFMQMP